MMTILWFQALDMDTEIGATRIPGSFALAYTVKAGINLLLYLMRTFKKRYLSVKTHCVAFVTLITVSF